MITRSWRLREDISMLSKGVTRPARSMHRRAVQQKPGYLLIPQHLHRIHQSSYGTRPMTSLSRKSQNLLTHTRQSYPSRSGETAWTITLWISRTRSSRRMFLRGGLRWINWFKVAWQGRRRKLKSNKVLERLCKWYYRWKMLWAPQYKRCRKLRLLGPVFALPCRWVCGL